MGVGEGISSKLNWQENTITSEGLTVHYLPTHHFPDGE